MTQPLPSLEQIETLHRKYAVGDQAYELVSDHCKIVAEIALWCADNIEEEVDRELLEKAALLHDIGSYAFFNEHGEIVNGKSYPQHAILGARILADEGLPQSITDVISTHVLLGLTQHEIVEVPWKLPARDYEPQSIEGELLCYADRFHSKKPVFNAYETFLDRLKTNLPLQGEKFESWSAKFGIPDLEPLARKYGHSIK